MTEKSDVLFETSFTVNWVAQTICDVVKVVSKVNGFNATKIGVGKGFMSYIIRLELEWEPKHENLPNVVVLKVPTMATVKVHFDKMDMTEEAKKAMDEEMADTWLPLTHRNECLSYEMFRESCPFPMPKSYYGREVTESQEGILIMEDFSLKADTVNIADGFSYDQVLQVIDALSTLHVFSLTHSGWEDKFKLMDKDAMSTWPEMIKSISAELIKMKPEYFDEQLFSEIEWCFDPDYLYDHVFFSHNDLNLPPVMVNGDMWSNNLMFEASGGKIGSNLLAVIDWQAVHPGNCTEDLCRVLVSSCPAALRREKTEFFLKYYYDQLCKKMAPKECPFSFEDVRMSYEVVLPFSMVFYMFGVPLMCNSPIVEGPNKEEKIEEMLLRAKYIIEDCKGLKKWYDRYA